MMQSPAVIVGAFEKTKAVVAFITNAAFTAVTDAKETLVDIAAAALDEMRELKQALVDKASDIYDATLRSTVDAMTKCSVIK